VAGTAHSTLVRGALGVVDVCARITQRSAGASVGRADSVWEARRERGGRARERRRGTVHLQRLYPYCMVVGSTRRFTSRVACVWLRVFTVTVSCMCVGDD
jgi:hypothetical protein